MTSITRYGYRQMSVYESVTNWRQKQRETHANFQANQASAISSFMNATQNQTSGMTGIVMNIATTRIQEAAQAKLSRLSNLKI